MADALQGPNGPHSLKADMKPLEQVEGEPQEVDDLGILRGPGTAPALEDEPVE